MSVEDALSILTGGVSGGDGLETPSGIVPKVEKESLTGRTGGTDLTKEKKTPQMGSGVATALGILTQTDYPGKIVSPKDPFEESNYQVLPTTNITAMSDKEYQAEKSKREAAGGSFLPTITAIGKFQQDLGQSFQDHPEQDEGFQDRYLAGESIAKSKGIDSKKVGYMGTVPVITDNMKKGLKPIDVENLYTYLSEQQRKSQEEMGKGIEEGGKQNLKYMELFSPYVEANLQDKIIKIQQEKPSIMNSLRTGNTQGAADEFVLDAVISGNEEAIQKALTVRNQLGAVAGEKQKEVKDQKVFGKELILSTAEMLPMMAKGAYYGAVPVIGPVLSTSMWARQGAGEILADMEKEGVPRDVSLPIALNAGLAYALVESAEVGQIKNIDAVKKIINEPIKKKIIYLLKEKGKDWVKENMEEIAQSLIQTGAVDVAKKQSGMEIDSEGLVKKYRDTVVETFKQSAGPLGLLTLLGFGAGAVKAGFENKGQVAAPVSQKNETVQSVQPNNVTPGKLSAMEILTGGSTEKIESEVNKTNGTNKADIGKGVEVSSQKSIGDFGVKLEPTANKNGAEKSISAQNDAKTAKNEGPTLQKTIKDFGVKDEEFWSLSDEKRNEIFPQLSETEQDRLQNIGGEDKGIDIEAIRKRVADVERGDDGERGEIENVNIAPSDGQKEVGNYRKGHIRKEGFDISIENPAQSVRTGTNSDGKKWKTVVNHDYGYIRGTKGADAFRTPDGTDQVDVFINPGASTENKSIYVVDQVDPKTGKFDEHKVMMGFDSVDEAKKAYLSNYEPGWKGFDAITEMTLPDFKEWVYSDRTQFPASKKPIYKEQPPKSKPVLSKIVETTEKEVRNWTEALNYTLKVMNVKNVEEFSSLDEDEQARRFNKADVILKSSNKMSPLVADGIIELNRQLDIIEEGKKNISTKKPESVTVEKPVILTDKDLAGKAILFKGPEKRYRGTVTSKEYYGTIKSVEPDGKTVIVNTEAGTAMQERRVRLEDISTIDGIDTIPQSVIVENKKEEYDNKVKSQKKETGATENNLEGTNNNEGKVIENEADKAAKTKTVLKNDSSRIENKQGEKNTTVRGERDVPLPVFARSREKTAENGANGSDATDSEYSLAEKVFHENPDKLSDRQREILESEWGMSIEGAVEAKKREYIFAKGTGTDEGNELGTNFNMQESGAISENESIAKRLSAAFHRFVGVAFDEENPRVKVLSPSTSEAVGITDALKKITGKDVVWYETDSSLDADMGFPADGVSFPRGVAPDLGNKIFINVNSSRPALWVAGHELWHFLEQNKEFNDQFWNVVRVTAKGCSVLSSMTKDYKEVARSEFAADIVGEMITDPEFWEVLEKQNQNLFDKIIRKIVEVLSRLSKTLKEAFAGTTATQEYASLVENVDDVRKTLARILSSYHKSKQGGVPVDAVSDVAAAVMSMAGKRGVAFEDKKMFENNVPPFSFEFDKELPIKKAVDARPIEWNGIKALYPRYEVVLEDGSTSDLWPSRPQFRDEAIKEYYARAQRVNDERNLKRLELEPSRKKYEAIYNGAINLIQENGGEIDFSKRDIEDKSLLSSIEGIKDAEIASALKMARMAIDYAKLGLENAEKYLNTSKLAISAANTHKLPEEQRGYSILRILSEVYKMEGGEPKTVWTEFPDLYRSDLDKNLKGDYEPQLNYDDETGLQAGSPSDIVNNIREQEPELYQKARDNVERIIADVYAGSSIDGHFYGFANDQFLYYVTPNRGDDGGFAHAAAMAAIRDVADDIRSDDNYAAKIFEKYYIRPQHGWRVIQWNVPATEDTNDIFSMFFNEEKEKEYYVVMDGEKRIGISDIQTGKGAAVISSMLNGKKDGVLDIEPDWGVLYENEELNPSNQPLFARSKSPLKSKEEMEKAKTDLTTQKEHVAELEREMNQMKGRLLSLPEDRLLERAEINLKIKSEKLEELDQIKNLILDYAKKIGIDGVGYNKVATQVSAARSVRGLEKAVRVMDQVWEGARRVEAIEALEKVLEKEYRRLNKVASGKLKSTIAPEYNIALKKYLDELTNNPEAQPAADGETPFDYKGWVDKMLTYYNTYAQKDVKQAESLKDLPIEIVEWMEDPSKQVPEKISQAIKYLFKHTISTMNTDELLKVLDDIESLKATGRTVKMAEDFARELELNRRAEAGAQVIKDATKDPASSEETFLQAAKKNKLIKWEWAGKLAEKGLWSLIDSERMVEWLSGFKNVEVLKNNILKPLYAAEKTKQDNTKAAHASFEKLYKDLDMQKLYQEKLVDIDFKDIYDGMGLTYKGKESGISLTTNQAMFVYANSQNPGNRAHLIGMFGNEGVAEYVIKKVVDTLPEQYKKAVDSQIDWYDNVQYYRMNPVFQREHEVSLPKEQRYFPIQAVKTDRAESAVVADYLARYSSKFAGVQKGMTKMRVHSQAPFRQMDYLGAVVRNILQTEHYIAYNDAVREVQRFLNHKEVRAAIEDKNEEVYSQLKDWLKAVAYGRVGGSENILDKTTDFMRNNFSTFALGLRLTTALQQFASLPRGMALLNNKTNLMKSAVLFMKNPKAALDFASKKSGLMAARENSYERELAESYEKGSIKQFAGLQNSVGKLKEWAMWHIGLTDRIVATMLWNARYQESIDQGYTDAEAVSLADELIRKTQSRGGVLYMPGIYRGSGLSRAFLMFSSDLNQSANLLFELAGKWNIQPTQENLAQIALMFMIPTLVIYLVNNALRLDEPEDYVYEFVHQFAGAVPFLGPMIDATIKTLMDEIKSKRGLIPDKTWTRYVANLSPAPLQTFETISEGIAKKNPEKIVTAGSQLFGIPYAAPKQYIQGGMKLFSGDVPDWRSLLWGKRKAMAKTVFGDMARRLYSPRPNSDDINVYSKWYKKLNSNEKTEFKKYLKEEYMPLKLHQERNRINHQIEELRRERKKKE